MHASFCVKTLEEAMGNYGPPEIMNTHQDSQFTGADWITSLTQADVPVSMDGWGRYLYYTSIERLWRSLKQEAINLTELQDDFQAQRGIQEWINFTIPRGLIRPLNFKPQWKHTGPTKTRNKWYET